MMHHEFEKGIGHDVSAKVFDVVNDVYMNTELFQDKEQVYSFWNLYGLDGFERLRKDIFSKRDLQKEIARLYKLSDLQNKLIDRLQNENKTLALKTKENDELRSIIACIRTILKVGA